MPLVEEEDVMVETVDMEKSNYKSNNSRNINRRSKEFRQSFKESMVEKVEM